MNRRNFIGTGIMSAMALVGLKPRQQKSPEVSLKNLEYSRVEVDYSSDGTKTTFRLYNENDVLIRTCEYSETADSLWA